MSVPPRADHEPYAGHMPTMTAPAPTAAVLASEVDHCYCCDINRAWCGADITDEPICPEACDAHPTCPLCLLAAERGCDCGEDD